MQHQEQIEREILTTLQNADSGKLRPNTLIKAAAQSAGVPYARAKSALVRLARRQQLIYSYRDPCSFVELPEE